MKVVYIGGGYVGTCSAAVMANFGHDVLVYDINKDLIKKLSSGDRDLIEGSLFEEGLGQLVVRNKSRIQFIDEYDQVKKYIDGVDSIFICVPTPEKKLGSGEYDLSYLHSAMNDLTTALVERNNRKQDKYVVVVIKSTIPIDAVDLLEEQLMSGGVKNFGLVSNPEFLVEGQAIRGSFSPDRVVVGAEKKEDFDVMRKIYSRFYVAPSVAYIETNRHEAIAGKLLSNYVLFSRLVNTYNVVGRVCEYFPDMQFEKVRKVIISDKRIGSWGFYGSIYAGGSCLTKDSLSLAYQLEQVGGNTSLIRQAIESNNFQRDNFYNRAAEEAKIDWAGATVSVLGVAFKRDTNDIRNSGAVDIITHLISDGAKEIRVYDPAALPLFKKMFDSSNDSKYSVIKYFDNSTECLRGSSACMLLADWSEFSAVDTQIKEVCHPPYVIMDGRRMLAHQYNELQNLGYDIIAVGSPFIKGLKN